MRFITLALALIVATGGLLACNSNEAARLNPQTNASPNTVPSPPADNARRITVAEAHSLMEKGKAFFVDTRTEKAFQESRIKGAVLISMGEIASKSDQLPRDKTIVTYCTWPNEHTSAGAVLNLKTKGMDNAAALLGGLDAWKSAGYPVEGTNVKPK